MVLLDLGVMVDHYASDITRMVSFGTLTKKMRDMRNLVEGALNHGISLVKSGMTLKSLEKEVRKYLGEKEKYFVHSIGHGIGIEVHESPRDEVFKENMVITVEPGLYLPGVLGVRLEEMILITKDGGKKLT